MKTVAKSLMLISLLICSGIFIGCSSSNEKKAQKLIKEYAMEDLQSYASTYKSVSFSKLDSLFSTNGEFCGWSMTHKYSAKVWGEAITNELEFYFDKDITYTTTNKERVIEKVNLEQGTKEEANTAKENTTQKSFTGNWSWTENDDDSFSLTLKQDGDNITGTHSAVAYGGNRVDNSLGEEEETSIIGTVSNGIATVKITSAYSGETSTATIKFIDKNTIEWTVTKPNGEHYFPDKAIMKK
jgi:hypothetical protein